MNEEFINSTTKNAFLGFLIIYSVFSIVPVFLAILSNYRHSFGGNSTKFTLMIASLIHAHYLLIIFGKNMRNKINYQATEALTVGTTLRSISQIVIQITFLTIMAIN